MADKMMTFGEHLEELRTRLKYAAYAVIACTLLCYAFSELLFAFIAQPLIRAWGEAGLGQPQLHFANPIEPFFTFLKISVVAGVFIASPVIFYQLWRFVAPGLYPREKNYALPFAVASGLFFFGGACFGYFLVFPYGFKFFLGFANSNMGRMEQVLGRKVGLSLSHTFKLTPTLMMGEYFGLVWRLLLAFGLIFELPLVVFFLAMAGLVNPGALWRFNRYFIVLSFIVAAMLTPPDVITQIFMAAPLLVLYNLSILFSFIFVKRRERRMARQEAAQAAEADGVASQRSGAADGAPEDSGSGDSPMPKR